MVTLGSSVGDQQNEVQEYADNVGVLLSSVHFMSEDQCDQAHNQHQHHQHETTVLGHFVQQGWLNRLRWLHGLLSRLSGLSGLWLWLWLGLRLRLWFWLRLRLSLWLWLNRLWNSTVCVNLGLSNASWKCIPRIQKHQIL